MLLLSNNIAIPENCEVVERLQFHFEAVKAGQNYLILN